MEKKKPTKTTTHTRATVNRQRQLALALRAVLDAYSETNAGAVESQAKAEQDAQVVLNKLGYQDLVGIPKQVTQLNEQLKAATEAQDWATVSKLGADLLRAQAGKVPRVGKVKVAKAEKGNNGDVRN